MRGASGGKKSRVLKILGAVLFVLILIFSLDFSLSKKKGILGGVQFSDAYSDKNGKLMQVYLTEDESFRIYKNVREYPPDFLEALLLQEDRKFYSHHGINPVALFKAGIETYVKKSRRIGASTITMQTAKLKNHLYTKNIGGKIRQIFTALRLEMFYSKQDILDAYVNLAPCGKNIEGFEAASWYFFGKSIFDTDLPEKLLLCVLPQNPSKRCPSVKNIPADLIDARSRLFEQWCKIHPEDESWRDFIFASPQLVCSFPETAPHFTRMLHLDSQGTSQVPLNICAGIDVSAELSAKKTLKSSKPHGIHKTTISTRIQNLAQQRVDVYLRQNRSIGINNASVLILNTETMEVEAAIGSGGFYNDDILGQIDGNISRRSPGSTLKPFIYALALEQGVIHFSTMLKDTPSSFSEYTPDNYGNTFKGPMHAWEALTESRNIPAVSLAREIKNPDLYDFLKGADIAGLKDKDSYGLSIVLGSADITPYEMISLYAALVNDGVQQKIRLVKNGDFRGEVSGGDKSSVQNSKRIMTSESSFIVRRMLEKNPSPVEYRIQEAKNFPVGYKTGTSIGFKDSWTCGFFGQYVMCVWIGNFDGSGNNAFLGRSAAAPLFFEIADSMIADGRCYQRMEEPPKGVSQVDVCAVSGMIPNGDCPEKEKTWFIPGVSPITKCKIHRKITIDRRTGYRTDEKNKIYCQTVVREFWPSDLMALFKQAGLPRLEPPDYPPDDYKIDSSRGYPPEIISPLAFAQYILRKSDPERNFIVLQASADGDTSELFWFAGSEFICRSSPGEKSVWSPRTGTFDITVLDGKGRSSTRKITVTETE